MVKIRLRRMGAKKRPFYRIVVADSRTSRDGRFIEAIGHYDPTLDPPALKVDKDRAGYWLGIGAQPSDVVRGLLKMEGFLGGPKVKAEEEEEPKPKLKKRARAAKAEEAKAAEAPAEKAPTPEAVEDAPAAAEAVEASAEPEAEEPAPKPEAAQEPEPEAEPKEEG